MIRKMSSSKKIRHINIWYFFITDKVQNRKIDIEYMLTSEIITGYFTKLLQGNLFCKMWNLIQGIDKKDITLYKKVYDKYIVANKQLIKEYHLKWKNSQ